MDSQYTLTLLLKCSSNSAGPLSRKTVPVWPTRVTMSLLLVQCTVSLWIRVSLYSLTDCTLVCITTQDPYTVCIGYAFHMRGVVLIVRRFVHVMNREFNRISTGPVSGWLSPSLGTRL